MAGETILVIDDAAESREFVVQHVLEPNGYRALTAKDGVEGMEMALEHQPDLILLDYNMPRMNGMEVLKALDSEGLSIPVILMTFQSSEDLAVEVFRMGARDYISKPFYPEEMEKSIYQNLSEVRLLREREALTDRVIQANRELKQRLDELNVLYGIGRNVSSLMNMEQLLLRVVDAAVLLTHAEQGHIHLLYQGELVCRAKKLPGSAHTRADDTTVQNPISQHVLKSGEALELPRKRIEKAGIKGVAAAAYVPMTLGQKVIGVIGVENISNDAGAFDKHDIALLSAISDYVTIAIANSRNYEAVRQLKARGTPTSPVDPERHTFQPLSPEVPKERQEVSVLFAAIAGYSTWGATAPPESVVEMLNLYLEMAAGVVLAWEGTLDRYSGDGLMAVFNAPDSQADHVHRAADAALALVKAAEEVAALYGPQLSYSVGVYVGDAVVGHIGAPGLAEYTAVGDAVELAKRVQAYAAPGQVLIAESVVKRLGHLAQTHPVGEISVKGHQEKTVVYELTGLRYPEEV